MDCLFKTSTKITMEEYKRFFKFRLFEKKAIIEYILISAFFLFSGIYLKNTFFILFPFILALVMWIIIHITSKKAYASHKIIQNSEVTYEFYDTYYTVTDANSNSRMEYQLLYRIKETKTNFYLLISKNQGYILTKADFPDGLQEFLEKLKTQVNSKKKK